MAQAIVIKPKLLKDIFSELVNLKREVRGLRSTVRNLEPVYGSRAWWKVSTNKALEEMGNGEIYEANNIDDFLKDLHK